MSSKRNGAERPTIESVTPVAAIPGGDLQIHGSGFLYEPRPAVFIGNAPAHLVVGSASHVVARVPDSAETGDLVVSNGELSSSAVALQIGALVADSLHPVANPAVDPLGNVYTTFSGSRGQKTPVAIYRIDTAGTITPFLTDMMNATGLAFDAGGVLHVSSRFDGVVYRVTASGEMSVFVEGMGVSTGIAFDKDGNLYVGDRSGTIFKVSPDRQIYVFATVEPSIAAYHLAFDEAGDLYLTGPTTSSYDVVWRITPDGEVSQYFRGLGRPQGLAFDALGNLYVAASYQGRRGVVRVTPDRKASLFLSGPNIVGLAFGKKKDLYVATTGALYRVPADVAGRRLP
jgi:sugar lactone lactonase YvrE